MTVDLPDVPASAYPPGAVLLPARVELPPWQSWTFARLPALLDRLGVPAVGVLHIGAHRGEEMPYYLRAGFRTIRLVEPSPLHAHELLACWRHAAQVVNAAVVDAPGPVLLHVDAASVRSSLSPRGDTEVGAVPVRAVRGEQVQDGCNVIVVDAQGHEADALATCDLRPEVVDLVVIECSERPEATDASPAGEVQAMLSAVGYYLVETWVHDQSGYVDQVWCAPRFAVVGAGDG